MLGNENVENKNENENVASKPRAGRASPPRFSWILLNCYTSVVSRNQIMLFLLQ